MTKEQIAKELTLAIVEKLGPTDRSTVSTMNSSLASEVAKYNTIYESLNINTDDDSPVVQTL